jgi:hypothetical protein
VLPPACSSPRPAETDIVHGAEFLPVLMRPGEHVVGRGFVLTRRVCERSPSAPAARSAGASQPERSHLARRLLRPALLGITLLRIAVLWVTLLWVVLRPCLLGVALL